MHLRSLRTSCGRGLVERLRYDLQRSEETVVTNGVQSRLTRMVEAIAAPQPLA